MNKKFFLIIFILFLFAANSCSLNNFPLKLVIQSNHQNDIIELLDPIKGNYFISLDKSGIIKIWSKKNNFLISSMEKKSSKYTSIALNNKYLLAGTNSNFFEIYNIEDLSKVNSMQLIFKYPGGEIIEHFKTCFFNSSDDQAIVIGNNLMICDQLENENVLHFKGFIKLLRTGFDINTISCCSKRNFYIINTTGVIINQIKTKFSIKDYKIINSNKILFLSDENDIYIYQIESGINFIHNNKNNPYIYLYSLNKIVFIAKNIIFMKDINSNKSEKLAEIENDIINILLITKQNIIYFYDMNFNIYSFSIDKKEIKSYGNPKKSQLIKLVQNENDIYVLNDNGQIDIFYLNSIQYNCSVIPKGQNKGNATTFDFHNEEKIMAIGYTDGTVCIYKKQNTYNNFRLYKEIHLNSPIIDVEFNQNDSKLAICEVGIYDNDFAEMMNITKPIHIFNMKTGEIKNDISLDYFTHRIKYIDNKLLITEGDKVIIDKQELKIDTIYSNLKPNVMAIDYDTNNEYLLIGTTAYIALLYNLRDNNRIIIDINSFAKYYENHYFVSITAVKIYSDKNILILGTSNGFIHIYNLTGDYIKSFYVSSGTISDIDIIYNDYIIAIAGKEKIQIQNLFDEKSVTIISSGNDWVIYNNIGFWDCTNAGEKLISMVSKNEAYNIFQFALLYNQPAEIMKTLNLNNERLEHYFDSLFEDRAKKFNLNLSINNPLTIPQITVESTLVKEDIFHISFKVHDDFSNVSNYNLYINNVPKYHFFTGKYIQNNNIIIKDEVKLIPGTNRIELSCTNELGIESYKEMFKILYQDAKKNKGNLYFVGIGISDYKQNNIKDLVYADDDVLCLEKIFSKQIKYFNKIHNRILINKDCTNEKIKDVKAFIKNAKENDTFIVYITGHGIHTFKKQPEYYFINYNTTIKKYKETATNFNIIYDLFYDIKPRKKVLLLNTCYSGNVLNQNEFIPENINMDRFIFNDLQRRTGLIIFTSTKCGELSYQNNTLKNSNFIYKLIECLSTTNADRNPRDNKISLKEIFNYLSSEVPLMRKGYTQHPMIIKDNSFVDLNFEIIKSD